MDKKVIDITKECRRAERKQKWDNFRQKAKDFWEDNKAVIIPAIPIVSGIAVKGISVLGKQHNLLIEQRNKDLRVYDPTIGHYWELRRKLDNRDWMEINRRHKMGESLGDILDSLSALR